MRAFRSTCFFVLFSFSFFSCSRGGETVTTPVPPVPATPAASAFPRLRAVVSASSGSPSLASQGVERPLSVGDTLSAGDAITTGDDSWAELSFGPEGDGAGGSCATVRIFPSSRFEIRSLSGFFAEEAPRTVELGLSAGIIAVKAGSLSGRDEFFVVTPNAAASVRGTAFLVESRESLSRVSVGAGAVAVLPKGPLLEGLLDGRSVNPVAGAVVRTAFAFAPVARPGEELRVGGAGVDGDEAYGALVVAAERARADGFSLEDIDDPSAFLAAEGSAANEALRAAYAAYRPAPLAADSVGALTILRDLADPTIAYRAEPIAMPIARPEKAAPPPAPRPVLWSSRVSKASISDSLTRVGDFIVALDASGGVHAVDQDGVLRWSSESGVLAATAVSDAVAVAAASALTVLDGETGVEKGSFAYSFTAAAPSAKPVAVPEGLAVATPRGIALLRAENAALVREIPVEGGVVSVPVLAGRELACVCGDGTLAFIDLSSGSISARIPLGLGAAPLPPRCKGDLLVASDRSGMIEAISISGRAVLWKRELGVRLNIEPELGDDRLFAWGADKTLRTLSVSDGADLASPIPEVLSPPLLSGGRLFWGGPSGSLVVADASSGRIVKKLPIAEGGSVRPIMVNGALYAGTGGGRIVKVDLSRL